MADMVRDGTRPQGEKHWKAVLTETQALEILAAYQEKNPPSYRATGRRYNVCRETIRALVLRRTWKHLPGRPTE